MGAISLKCPDCGGSADAEDARDGICTCRYCGHAFAIKEVLEQPKVTVKSKTVHNVYHIGQGREKEGAWPGAGWAGAEQQRARMPKLGGMAILVVLPSLFAVMLFAFVSMRGNRYIQDDPQARSEAAGSIHSAGDVAAIATADIRSLIDIGIDYEHSAFDGEGRLQWWWREMGEGRTSFEHLSAKAVPKEGLHNGDIVHVTFSGMEAYPGIQFVGTEFDYEVQGLIAKFE